MCTRSIRRRPKAHNGFSVTRAVNACAAAMGASRVLACLLLANRGSLAILSTLGARPVHLLPLYPVLVAGVALVFRRVKPRAPRLRLSGRAILAADDYAHLAELISMVHSDAYP